MEGPEGGFPEAEGVPEAPTSARLQPSIQQPRLRPQAPGAHTDRGEAVRPRPLPRAPPLPCFLLLPTAQPSPLGSLTTALDVRTVGPTPLVPTCSSPIGFAPPPRARVPPAPTESSLLASRERDTAPTGRGDHPGAHNQEGLSSHPRHRSRGGHSVSCAESTLGRVHQPAAPVALGCQREAGLGLWEQSCERQEPAGLGAMLKPRARGLGQAGYQPVLGTVKAQVLSRRVRCGQHSEGGGQWGGQAMVGGQASRGGGPVPCLGVPGPPPQPPAPSEAATEEKFRAGPCGQWPTG